jgi:hypothetical protein
MRIETKYDFGNKVWNIHQDWKAEGDKSCGNCECGMSPPKVFGLDPGSWRCMDSGWDCIESNMVCDKFIRYPSRKVDNQ